MDLFILGVLYLLGQGQKQQQQRRPPAQQPARPAAPPAISDKLRRELEQVGASSALAVGLARWASLYDPKPDSGGAPWLGVEITSNPPPATVAARILETLNSLFASAENTSPKPLATTAEDKLWWAFAGWQRPEMFVASPGGGALEAARQLASMNLPESDRVLLNKANYIAFGSKVVA